MANAASMKSGPWLTHPMPENCSICWKKKDFYPKENPNKPSLKNPPHRPWPKSRPAGVIPAMLRPVNTAPTTATTPAPTHPVLAGQAQVFQVVESTAQADEQPESAQQPALDENAKQAIKHIIIETSAEHLGIFSRDLLDKTERAQNAAQLRACISQWHMAMQESRSGREKCVEWLNEVNGLLHHGMAKELKSA